jgi:hypothetical protein
MRNFAVAPQAQAAAGSAGFPIFARGETGNGRLLQAWSAVHFTGKNNSNRH